MLLCTAVSAMLLYVKEEDVNNAEVAGSGIKVRSTARRSVQGSETN